MSRKSLPYTPKKVSDASLPTDRCETCIYWRRMDTEHGQCRKNPPLHVISAGQDGPIVVHGLSRPDDWCGSYQGR